MSNLIKSGKVIDLSIPVNVGISHSFDNIKSPIVEKAKVISKAEPIKEEQLNNSEPAPQAEPQKKISEEEILKEYIEKAKKKADAYYKSEMDKAYAEGVEKAKQEALTILENANAEREKLLSDIANEKEEITKEYKEEIKKAEKDLLTLSLDIVEKIINYEVDKSDNYILGIIKDALDRVVNKKDVIVKLSTADYYTVLSNKKYLMTNVKGFGEIDIIQDESMELGSCIVDTPLGVIDSGIQVRMDNIQKEVMRILNEE